MVRLRRSEGILPPSIKTPSSRARDWAPKGSAERKLKLEINALLLVAKTFECRWGVWRSVTPEEAVLFANPARASVSRWVSP
jgi:hypothetical protein